jgi:leucyl aminopeptidase
MQFSLTNQAPPGQRSECLVLPVFASRELSAAAQAADGACGGQLAGWLKQSPLDGASSQAPVTLYGLPCLSASRVVLVGLGARDKLDAATFVKAARKAADAVLASGATSAAVYLGEASVAGRDGRWALRQCVETFSAQAYRFDEMKSRSQRDSPPRLKRVQLATASGEDPRRARLALAQGEAVAAGTALARTLGNRPPNVCTPSHLASEARALARRHQKLSVRVVEQAQMKRLGMGAFLAVARGSREAPKLIALSYRGGKQGTSPIALVGKGVTFDTGGVSLKPASAMDEMKFDMCGAASVLGTMEVVARLSLPINVVALIAATENMPDGNATRPGDVVTSMSGQTVEILNTDAEGRLILCDTLTYAARFKPDTVIDVATLTGACVVALGGQASGLWSNDDGLAAQLLEAGTIAGDRAWQMPLWPEYEESLRSNFADLANVGGRDAGAVTAAVFLGRFARDYRWAHLDIAGTAWKQGKAKGATGRPVALLSQFLLARSGATG